jgi:protein involved in polysaccharide export with SLBB domain
MRLLKLSWTMGTRGIFGLLLSMVWLAGCATTDSGTRFEPLPGEEQQVSASAPGEILDVITPGSAITIVFSDIPIQVAPIEERVKEDGTITLLYNQTFAAAGKTRRQLETEIRERYVPRYFVNMTVSVKQQENTRFYFVGGEVRNPGRQVYLGPMTVLKAIQSCGDFTDFANRRRVQLIRVDGTIHVVNANSALRDPKQDLPVYPGDRIHVPRSIW